jgi:hypothetical protein
VGRSRRRTVQKPELEALELEAGVRSAEGRAAYAEGRISGAELACIYIAERVRRSAGGRFLQAELRPPLPSTSTSPWVRLFAEHALYRIPSAVPQALLSWAEGSRPVDLLFHVPSPGDVLSVQARGRRIVSLLEDGIPTAPHEDGLAFAVHDLCHLEKFMDPAHHIEQVGFFALLDRAMQGGRWDALDASLDPAWLVDRDHIIADMNGSAAFLYLTLKNKLKLAVRRRLARARGGPCPSGPLDPDEVQACDAAYEVLLDLLDLRGEARAAARALSRRQGGEALAARLCAHFTEAGVAAIEATV